MIYENNSDKNLSKPNNFNPN